MRPCLAGVEGNVRFFGSKADKPSRAKIHLCLLWSDIVAKRFFASRRATLIQKIDPPRNIDSSGAPVGFESCALGGGRRLLQQNLPKADSCIAANSISIRSPRWRVRAAGTAR